MSEQTGPNTETEIAADQDEQAYLLKRAEEHRYLAESASEYESRLIHEQLERLYRQRAQDPDQVLPD